jgi:hypothetical protein
MEHGAKSKEQRGKGTRARSMEKESKEHGEREQGAQSGELR